MATIASLLRDRVTLQVRSVDRLFLQAHVPRLMTSFQVVRFLLDRGFSIPSPALLAKIGRAYVAAIDRYAADNAIPVLRFGKGESKEQIARRCFRAAERDGRFGVVLIGVAQEKAIAWRGWRRGGRDSHPHFEFGRQAIFVNHYYFYIRDRDWGPAFIKTCAYAPFPAWVYLNDHEWAKRQAERQGLAFEALDSGRPRVVWPGHACPRKHTPLSAPTALSGPSWAGRIASVPEADAAGFRELQGCRPGSRVPTERPAERLAGDASGSQSGSRRPMVGAPGGRR